MEPTSTRDEIPDDAWWDEGMRYPITDPRYQERVRRAHALLSALLDTIVLSPRPPWTVAQNGASDE